MPKVLHPPSPLITPPPPTHTHTHTHTHTRRDRNKQTDRQRHREIEILDAFHFKVNKQNSFKRYKQNVTYKLNSVCVVARLPFQTLFKFGN